MPIKPLVRPVPTRGREHCVSTAAWLWGAQSRSPVGQGWRLLPPAAAEGPCRSPPKPQGPPKTPGIPEQPPGRAQASPTCWPPAVVWACPQRAASPRGDQGKVCQITGRLAGARWLVLCRLGGNRALPKSSFLSCTSVNARLCGDESFQVQVLGPTISTGPIPAAVLAAPACLAPGSCETFCKSPSFCVALCES